MSGTTFRRFAVYLAVLAISVLGERAANGQIFPDTDAPQGLRPAQQWDDQPDWVTSLAFTKDAGQLCVGTYEAINVLDTRGRGPNKTLVVKPGYIKSLSVSPDGRLVAAGHYQAVSIIDAATWTIMRTIGEHAGYVTGTAFSPDGRLLVTACEDATASLWNVSDGKLVRQLVGHSYPVLAVAVSRDGSRIATAAGDENRPTQPGEVKVWNAADGKILYSFTNPRKAATGVAFSSDGKVLASTGFDERVIVYDLVQGKATSFFAGHSRPTNAVLFARGGTVAVSAAGGRAKDGNEVKIWERTTGTELATLAAHSAKVDAIALSRDESLLATGGYDKRVLLWNAKPLLEKQSGSADAVSRGPDKAAVAKALATAKTAGDNAAPARQTVRVGIIGLDTSHAAAFTDVLNDPKAAPDVAGFRVVAAYPRGSADIESSASRIPANTEQFRKRGVEIVDSIDALLKKVDVVLLETNDGRPHLEQALAVMKSGKRMFIDKPVAGSLADVVAIFEAADRYHVPVFSSSSLRFGKKTLAARNGAIGRIQSCETQSPCHLEKSHPDLFWYGIHGVESLFTVMGTGCRGVRRVKSTPTDDVVVGAWEGGRTGTFHGTRPHGQYTGTARGPKGTLDVGQYEGYRPLVVEIVKFFRTGVAPVSPEETLELYAFMEAADESKRQHGAEVNLKSVLDKARAEAAKKRSP